MVERIDIERALDKLSGDETGLKFQSLAVVLAKLRWPELIACERHKDLGLDAYAPLSVCSDGLGKGVASSTTGTLNKLKSDAEKIHKHYPDVSLLVFYTTEKVTQATKTKWKDVIDQKYGYPVVIASREEIIASLQVPDNIQLCRSHLDMIIPYKSSAGVLFHQAQKAAAAVTSEWAAHPRLTGRPRIPLRAVRVNEAGADTVEIVATAQLQSLLLQGRRIVLEGPAGRGKTTMLVQLAEANQGSHGIPLLIDLPNWVRSGKDILDYLASSPPFRAHGIDANELARLSRAEPCFFLLNGWNEITELHSSAAVDLLRGLERSFPTAGIITATRTHHIVPPLPGAARFRLLPLTPDQRSRYLEQALGNGPARDLDLSLLRDTALEELTRTPFVLSEVTALFRSGVPIPRTKLAMLRAVVGLMERSEEHADQLQSPPVRGLAYHYLSALAMHLTARGDVLLAESEARSICRATTDSLRSAGQIIVLPEPAELLNVLASHHILERIDYPAVSFRFEHQQFQEYYCALRLQDELNTAVASHDPANENTFARTYINDPSWEEALCMIAADHGSDGRDLVAAKRLVQLSLPLDAVFAARLSYLSSPSLWKEIRDEMHARLRALYTGSKHPHRNFALAAILATGSDEFSDILLPLLTHADQQIRLSTYRSGMPFHTSSLGMDWRRTVATWTENQRAEFVSELTQHQGIAEVGLIFARSDPSLTVRLSALNGLSWIGHREVVAEILLSLSDPDFEFVIQKFNGEPLSPEVRQRAVIAYRALFAKTTNHKSRLQITLALAELGDADIAGRLKPVLDSLTPDLVRELSDHVLRPVVEILRIEDPQWLSQWITNRIIQGVFRQDYWVSLVLGLPQSLRDQLLHRVFTEDLLHSGGGGVTMLLRAFADAEMGRVVFIALRDHHQAFVADHQDHLKRSVDNQLRDLLHSFPLSTIVDGLSSLLAKEPEAQDLHIISDRFRLRNRESEDADPKLDQPQRQQIREYLKSSVRFALSQEDHRGELKGYLSPALAAVGEPNDMDDVMEMIRADIQRKRQGQAAMAQGNRSERARGSPMSWSGWHVEALVHLGHTTSEPFLLNLLHEPEYEVDAALALQIIARKIRSGPNAIRGARFGPIGRDFRKVRSGSTDWRSIFVEDLRVKYAVAIRGRILDIFRESNSGDPKDLPSHRLKELAKVLAALDPEASTELILKIAALPTRSDGWHRVALLETLVFAGIRLPTDVAFAIVEPIVTECRVRGIHGNDGGLLARILSLLPFVEDPAKGVKRLQAILSEFKFSWYNNRDLLMALAQCSDESAFTILIGAAEGLDDNAFQQIAREWLEAVASSKWLGASAILLSFIDPATSTLVGNRTLPDYALNFLAGCLSTLAKTTPSITARITELTVLPLSVQQRNVIAKVIAQLNSPTALYAGLNLLDDHLAPQIPYEIYRAIENVVLERRPYADSQSYTLAPRAANTLKTRLVGMMKDPQRSKSAQLLLTQIEEWRLEYGRPPSEPRHPTPNSGEMWPPI